MLEDVEKPKVSEIIVRYVGRNPWPRLLEFDGAICDDKAEVRCLDSPKAYIPYYYTTMFDISCPYKLVKVEVLTKAATKGKVMLHFVKERYRRYILPINNVRCVDTDIDKAFTFFNCFHLQVEMSGMVVMPEVTLHFEEVCSEADEEGVV